MAMFEEAGFVSAPLLKVAEAAKYLGVARKTVYDLIEWGELRAVKMNGAVHIEQKSLDAFRTSGRLT
ncbi:MAG: helix-turn-helix domain-containing protein [Syntrophobacteraceae bacterium]